MSVRSPGSVPGPDRPESWRNIPILMAAWTLLLAPALLHAGVNAWSGRMPAATPHSDTSTILSAADPSNPDVVYAASSSDLYRSDDGGRTWTHLGSFSSIQSLLVDPTSPSTLLLGTTVDDGATTSNAVLKSVDGGRTWTQTGMSHVFSTLPALASSATGSSVCAGTFEGTAFKSVDGGNQWFSLTRPNSNLRTTIEALVIDPTSETTIYAGGRESESSYYYFFPKAPTLSKSTDGGATWSDLSAAVGIATGKAIVRTIAIDAANPSTLFLGLESYGDPGVHLLRSTDGGSSWAAAANGLPPKVSVYSLVVDPQGSSTLYAGTSAGVYQTRDSGATWIPFSQQLAGVVTRSLAIDPEGRFLHAATDYGSFDVEIGRGALDVSSNRLLFWDDDRLSVRTLISEVWVSTPEEGPFTAWNATAIADGADGLSRILWQAGDGRVSLENVGPAGSQATFRFPAEPGWTAIDVSVDVEGRTQMLRTSADGQMRITTVGSSGSATRGPAYGPYDGWSANAIADGPDGASWVLWRRTDGTVGISRYRDGFLEISFRWAASFGWSAEDIAVGADGLPRLLWTNPDGRTSVATVGGQGQLTDRVIYNNPSLNPLPRYRETARRIAASSDGTTRVLWTTSDGLGSIWILNPDNSLQGQHRTPTP